MRVIVLKLLHVVAGSAASPKASHRSDAFQRTSPIISEAAESQRTSCQCSEVICSSRARHCKHSSNGNSRSCKVHGSSAGRNVINAQRNRWNQSRGKCRHHALPQRRGSQRQHARPHRLASHRDARKQESILPKTFRQQALKQPVQQCHLDSSQARGVDANPSRSSLQFPRKVKRQHVRRLPKSRKCMAT